MLKFRQSPVAIEKRAKMLVELGLAPTVEFRLFQWRLEIYIPGQRTREMLFDTFHDMMRAFDFVSISEEVGSMRRYFPDGSVYRDAYQMVH